MSGKISIDRIKDALVIDTTNQRALSLCISGMDPVLSDRTRLLSIEAAEELIQEKPVYEFVKNRFLARILPESAEVESAITLADSASTSLISDLYRSMLESQESIRALQNVWKKFAPKYFAELDEKSAAESAFIENGLFADMVDAAVKENKSEMKLLTVTYGSNRELSNSLPSSKRSVIIINNFVNDFLAKLNFAGKKAAIKESVKTPDKPVVVDPIKQLIQDFGIQSRQQVQKSRRMGSEAVKEKVDQQIMQIERLIQQNNIQRTDSYLFDLVKFQLEHGKKEFLAMTLCNLAKTAMNLNDLATAERLITYAGLLGVEDPVIPSTQAELLRRNGFTKEALVVYEETISLFPEDVVAKNGRAEVLKEMNKLDEALAGYNKTISLFPNNVFPKNGRAEVLKEMNELDKALAAYDETISQFPEDVVAKNGRAEVLKEMNELDEALAAFDETINLFPNDVFAKNGRAGALKEMNRIDEALAAYDETINQFPNEVVPKTGRAEVLKEMNRLDEALAAFDETINRFPNNVVAKNGRAEVLKEMNNLDEALASYDETISLFPNDVFSKNGRAEVLKEMNRLDDALADYQSLVELYPNNLVTRNGFANILVLKGRFENVQSFLQIENPVSKEDWIGYHILAMSYLKAGDLGEAIKRFTFGLKNSPNKDYFANALAIAKIKKREFTSAVEMLKEDIENINAKQKRTRLLLLGHSYAELHRNDEAVNSLNASILANAPNPLVHTLKNDLLVRYELGEAGPLAPGQIPILDQKIENEEFRLALAA